MKNKNAVIFHYHIFKNAGTSVDFALKNFFGKAWKSFEGAHAHDIQSSLNVKNFLKENSSIKAVSSHLARPPVPQFDSQVLPIVFLREPLVRAKSVYEFSRKDIRQPFYESIRKMCFSDYLEWALNEKGGVVIRDYQVIHLSTASFCETGILDAIADESHLLEAIDIISDFPVIGMVEDYTNSIKLIEKVYKEYFPALKLDIHHANRSGDLKTLDDLEMQIPQSVLYEFNRKNTLDKCLYKYAKTKFNQLCNDFLS